MTPIGTHQTSSAVARIYDSAYFGALVEGSTRSATLIVPRILGLFPNTTSVIDLGCGTGVWLHLFKGNGVPRVLGVDGGLPTRDLLMLPDNEFRAVDLSEPVCCPEKFDLALSLEVAQHLPPGAAQTFIASICRLSDLVIFGAAIPGQSGPGHVNERWPSYWAALFDAKGYELFDILRPLIWYDQRIEWWYAQNSLVFVRRTRDDLMQVARAAAANQGLPKPLDLVHPRCFEYLQRLIEARNKALALARRKKTSYETRMAEAEAKTQEANARAAEAEAKADEAKARASVQKRS